MTSQQFASEWFEFATADLEGARILVQRQGHIIRISLTHAQQAAEKALKGALIAADRRFSRTHDIDALASLCTESTPNFLFSRGISATAELLACARRVTGV